MSTEKTPRPQIMGSEMEYAVSVRLKGKKKFQPLNGQDGSPSADVLVFRYFPDDIKRAQMGHAHSLMLQNGSRFYIDVGSHPEMATAEQTEPEGVVLYEFADEKIVAESLRNMVRQNEDVEAAILQKGVMDMHGNSWGWHMNIMANREDLPDEPTFKKKLYPLLMHYATSRPMLGLGRLRAHGLNRNNEPLYRYSFGQKILDTQYDYHKLATEEKAIISLRDETFALEDKYRRIHIVGEDPHISPWATEMAFGTYSLMLLAIKEGRLPDLQPANSKLSTAIQIARIATFDLDGSRKYDVTIDGKISTNAYTANEMQRIYIEAVMKLNDMPEWGQGVVERWQDFVEGRDGDYRKLTDSDAITKLARIERKLASSSDASKDVPWAARATDLNYTSLMHVTSDNAHMDTDTLMGATAAGLFRRRGHFARYMPSQEAIDNAIKNPPETTRAYERGMAIKRGIVTLASWEKYHTGNGEPQLLSEPWRGANPMNDEWDLNDPAA